MAIREGGSGCNKIASRHKYLSVPSESRVAGISRPPEAFQTFLRLGELDWPPSIDHPVVGLFLLVCDIAINPGAGFPMPLRVFTTFIEDVDPGFRFLFLCRIIAQRPALARAIQQYSRAEYAEVSEALTAPLLLDSPLTIAETVTRWVSSNKTLESLMAEHLTFDYAATNLPVRLLFSHFLAFGKAKLLKPEFFCWPGAWMTGDRLSPEIGRLFDSHSAPFIDKAEDGGIYPRLMTEKSEAVIQATFEMFYAVNVTYDMTRQWIAKAGQFEYDYRWLSSSGTQTDIKNLLTVISSRSTECILIFLRSSSRALLMTVRGRK